MAYVQDSGRVSEMQRNCKDCKYYEKSYPCCDYLDIEGHSRPCPAGDNCTVKVVGEYKKNRALKPLKPLPREEWELYYFGRKR